MARHYNLWSFYLILICLGLAAYSLYSNTKNIWLIALPNYILLIISVIAFIFGIIGFQDRRNWMVKTRSWLTIILPILLLIPLCLALLFTTMFSFAEKEHIKTVNSPDNDYTIEFYRRNPGATGTIGVSGVLNGPLWFKKKIYYEPRTKNVDVKWKSDDKVSINNHILNLSEGDTYGYQ